MRHYTLEDADRLALGRRIVELARRNGLIVLWAGAIVDAHRIGADGVHASRGTRLPRRAQHLHMLRTAPVHNLRALRRAERSGADCVFLSPVFATRSHPQGKTLGAMRAVALARSTRLPVVALGGITPLRAAQMQRLGLYGWAAIDAFTAQT
jgi:thiamine-phosphate pyrophosphorylase